MTKRFHNAAILHENTVGQHSWGVAWFCYLLSDQPRVELILAALAHDMAEQITGDVPAPAKRLLGLQQLLHQRESEVLERFGFHFQLTADEEKILHIADCMDGMMFCIRERMFGNRFIETVFYKFQSYVNTILVSDVQCNMFENLMDLWSEANGDGER
jgi:5'-deoxynucleotidase YfbR-like HD superfamily hydrolase